MKFPLRSLRAVVCSLGLLTIFPTHAYAQKVLLLAADFPASVADVQRKLEGTGLLKLVDVIDVRGAASTPTTLLGYDAILTWSNAEYGAPGALGSALADYVDSGRGVVQAPFSNYSAAPTFALGGRWQLEGYEPYTRGDIGMAKGLTLGPRQLSHAILDGVVGVNNGTSGFHHTGVTAAGGGEVVASWSNGQLLVVTRAGPQGGRVVGLNLFPPSSFVTGDLWDQTTDGALLMANALVFAAGPPAATNALPTADAGEGQTREANSAAGAAFTLTAAGSDPDGDPLTFAWSGDAAGTGQSLPVTLAPPVGSTSVTYVVTLTVSDGKGGEATDVVDLTVTDTRAPVLSNVPSPMLTATATSAAGATVAYGPVTALDAVDGLVDVTCSKSGAFPIGDTPVTCSATDTRGNSTTATFTVRVLDATTPGKMWGEGSIRVGTLRNQIEFAVSERAPAFEGALLQVRVKNEQFPGKGAGRFWARTTDFVAFSDDPSVRPGVARVDTVVFSGTGDWNGAGGYRYEMSAVDKGDGSHSRMCVRLTVTGPNGAVVARVDGTLGSGGSSGSSALRRR